VCEWEEKSENLGLFLDCFRLFGTGALSQYDSGTKKKSRTSQKPTTMATILFYVRISESTLVRGFSLPEYPSPTHRLNNCGTDQRYQVLTTKKQKSVYSEAIGALVEEENLCNCSGWQTFNRADRDPLKDSGNQEGVIAWRSSAPDRSAYE
jgi:hypothetical protein